MGIFADSNRVSVRYIAETAAAWGITPLTGITNFLRVTAPMMKASKETKTSDELRSDRMVSSIAEVGASSEGEMEFELSAGSQDDMLQAFLLGQWTRPMTFSKFQGISVSWTANNIVSIAGGNFTSYFVAGRRITTGNFLTPENNGIFQVTSAAFSGGATNVTVTTTTSVVESGGVKSFLQDANDVIIFKNTSIRAGTAGASTFDSNGGNAFASAITAGQLVAGQTIRVDGYGTESGTFTLTGNPTDGETVTVNDGVDSIIFEFDNNGIPAVSGSVLVTIGAAAANTATNLADAINAQRVRGLTKASAKAAAAVVTVKNHNKTGGTLADASAVVTTVSFTGGSLISRNLYTITSLTDDVIGVTPNPGIDANAGTLAISIRGSMVRNPSNNGNLPHQLIVPQSFSMERSFEDINLHQLQTGLRVGEFNLNIEAGEIITGSFSLKGKETTMKSVNKLNTAPYIPLKSTTSEVMNATANVGELMKDGVVLSSAIQSIDFKGDASLRNQGAVASKFAKGIGTGRFALSGSLTAYFENAAFYNNFLDHDTISLRFNIKDVEGNSYTYTIPSIKVTSDDVSVEGIDEDVMEPMEWEAFRDTATETMLQVDRFSTSDFITE